MEKLTVTPEEFAKRDSSVQVLDIRGPREFSRGAIKNAVNIYLHDLLSTAESRLSKDAPVYVYCGSGPKGKIAANVLLDLGFDAYNVEGGLSAIQRYYEETS
jgi:rhodanese-related sulfurtransferase